MKSDDRIRRIASRVSDFPTLPSIMQHVVEMIEDPSTTASQLGKFIAYDQAFTIKILKLANSAFYGRSRKIGSVDMALVVLGFEEIKNLGLTIVVIDAFKDPDYYRHVSLQDFWTHGIAVAAGCKVLAVSQGIKTLGELFVAGLLHDIGTLVISRQMPDDLQEVIELCGEKKIPQQVAELEVLGFTHADVSGYLCDQWKLPLHQVSAIANHHHPLSAKHSPELCLTVAFANELAHRAGHGPGISGIYTSSVREFIPEEYKSLKLHWHKDTIDWKYYTDGLVREMMKAHEYMSLLNGDGN